MKNLRMGIIGIGNMGSAHVSCLLRGEVQGMTLCAVCDLVPEKANRAVGDHAEVAVFSDYRELLASGLVDAVIIAVPHKLHAAIAMEAFEKGLHVLTEKPVDVSVSKALAVNEAAKQSGKVFGIMFNQRTNPLYAKARELVHGGELGELKRTVWIVTNWYRTQHYYDSGDWRATWSGEGGGVLLNQAPHNLDLWQWICGMPESVTAFCDVAKYHNIEVEDDATLFTRYANGAVGTFITSTGEYPGTNRLEISGTKGKILLENGSLKFWRLASDEALIRQNSPESSPKIDCELTEMTQEKPETAHRGILQNFADAVLMGKELLAPGTDGIYELTLSNAAYLSEFQGNCEVNLPFNPQKMDELLSHLSEHSAAQRPCKAEKAPDRYENRWQVRW